MKGVFYLLFLMSIKVAAQDVPLDFYVPQHFMDYDCDISTQDGFHVFEIEEISNYSLVMYDKWGEIVWESKDIKDYWLPINDKSKNLIGGVYFWRITYSLIKEIDLDGEGEKVEKEIAGNTYYLKR